jgi:hypothetical protein
MRVHRSFRRPCIIANADNASLRTDVDRLLGVYRCVRPDAPVVVSNASGLTVHTMVRKELAAAGNLHPQDVHSDILARTCLVPPSVGD